MVPILNASAAPRLHHVGFVVVDLEASAPGMARALLTEWSREIFTDPLQRVKVTFLRGGHQSPLLELVEPLGDDSPVRRFLGENGGGLHHLCYEVPSIPEHLARIRAGGGLIVSRPKPAVAFGGRLIAWALTREKLLLEFLQAEMPV
ncbi:MAG: VOC family protein [Steroidobacteraceae bacterium]